MPVELIWWTAETQTTEEIGFLKQVINTDLIYGTKQVDVAAVTIAKEEPTLSMRNAHRETKQTMEM